MSREISGLAMEIDTVPVRQMTALLARVALSPRSPVGSRRAAHPEEEPLTG